MVRKHTLNMLGGWTEEKLLAWGNERVKKDPKIKNFKDKSISNCKFLFNLLATIEPRAINWELVEDTDAEDVENKDDKIQQNAKYVISVARKLGCTIFCIWEDIKEVNPKQIMTFIGATAIVAEKGKQEEMPDISEQNPEGNA